MSRFDRSCTTFCWSAIVIIALSCARRTDGRTEQTDRFSISISRVSMLTRDKKLSTFLEITVVISNFLGVVTRLRSSVNKYANEQSVQSQLVQLIGEC